MREEAAVGLFTKKKAAAPLEYDREKEYPVLRCSICNGEQVAGFKDRESGRFREITLIRSQSELELFMKQCGVSSIAKEY